MCDATTLVPIPPLLWEANAVYDFKPEHPEYGIDDEGRRCLALDACIVPAVQALWDAGIVTLSCCCGHGDPWGVITVQTQAGVGQRGAMVMRAERYDELLAAEARVAALTATLEAVHRYGLNVAGCSEAYGEQESAHLWNEIAAIAEEALWPRAALAPAEAGAADGAPPAATDEKRV